MDTTIRPFAVLHSANVLVSPLRSPVQLALHCLTLVCGAFLFTSHVRAQTSSTFTGKWTEDENGIVYAGRTYESVLLERYGPNASLGPWKEDLRDVFDQNNQRIAYIRDSGSSNYLIYDPEGNYTYHALFTSFGYSWNDSKLWTNGVPDQNTDAYFPAPVGVLLPSPIELPATARSLTVVGTDRLIMTSRIDVGNLSLTPAAAQTITIGMASASPDTGRYAGLKLADTKLSSTGFAAIGHGSPGLGAVHGVMEFSGSTWLHPAGLIEVGGGGGTGRLVVNSYSLVAGSLLSGTGQDPSLVLHENSGLEVASGSVARFNEIHVSSGLSAFFYPKITGGIDYDLNFMTGLRVIAGSLTANSLVVGSDTLEGRADIGETSDARIGSINVDKGRVIIHDASLVEAGTIEVHNGSINVENGTNLPPSSNQLTIGTPNPNDPHIPRLNLAPESGEVANLTVINSNVTIHGQTHLGRYGSATVSLFAGGVLDIRGKATLGESESSEGGAAGSGTVTVDGGVLRAQDLELGYSYFAQYGPEMPVPTGILRVGSRMEVTGRTETFNFGPSTLSFHYGGSMLVGTGGTLDFTAAGGKVLFLDPSDGGNLDSPLALTNHGLIIGGDSTGSTPLLGGHIDFGDRGGTLSNSGTIAPGHSAGWLGINGNLTLESASILLMEIGGTVRGAEYDALTVTGAVTAGGTLTVTFINGFSPAPGATFDLFDFGSVNGSFATVNLPAGYDWNVDALNSTGGLSVAAIPEPGTWAALLGLAALAAAALRRRTAQ